MLIELGVAVGALLLTACAWYDLANRQNIPVLLVQGHLFLGFVLLALRWPQVIVLAQLLASGLIIIYLSKKTWSLGDTLLALSSIMYFPQFSLFLVMLSAALWFIVSTLMKKKEETFVPFILAAYLGAWALSASLF